MAFDPKTYLAQKAAALEEAPTAAPRGGGFDPKAYLRAKAAGGKPEVGAGTAFLRGAGQGATMGFADEINGAIQALGETILPESLGGAGDSAKGTFGERYRRNRGTFRREDAEAEAAHGGLYLAGNVAGSIPSAFIPAGAAARGLRAGQGLRAALNASRPAVTGLLPKALAAGKAGLGQGALFGAGASGADLTEGEVGQFALDTVVGGAAGGALGAGGAALGHGLGKVAGWAKGKAASALARSRAAAQAARESERKSITGSLGGEIQKGSRLEEQFANYLDDPNIPDKVKLALREWKDSPQSRELIASVLENQLEQAPNQAGRITAKKAALEAFDEATEGAVESEAQRLSSPKEAKAQLLRRAVRYGLPMLGSAVGGAIGGPPGLAIGALAGAGTRPAMQSWLRFARLPSTQRALAETLEGVAGGGAKLLGTPSITSPTQRAVLELLPTPQLAPPPPLRAVADERELEQRARWAALRNRRH